MSFLEKMFTGAKAHELDFNSPEARAFFESAYRQEQRAGQDRALAKPEMQLQSREQQQAYADSLKAQAAGQGPSAAAMQYNAAQQQQRAAAASQAASMRGVSPALAARQAMQQSQMGAQQAAQQAAIGRQQEMFAASQQLGGTLQGMRSQDLQNQQSFLDQEQRQRQLAMGYNQMGMGVAQANQAALNAAEGINVQGAGQLMSGLAQAGTQAAMALSDEDLKTAFKSGSKKVRSFLDHISANDYEYKDGAKNMKGGGKGRYVSVTAQELEKTPVGKSMVIETPKGKMVDYGKGFGAMLAAMADLHQRTKKLEGV